MGNSLPSSSGPGPNSVLCICRTEVPFSFWVSVRDHFHLLKAVHIAWLIVPPSHTHSLHFKTSNSGSSLHISNLSDLPHTPRSPLLSSSSETLSHSCAFRCSIDYIEPTSINPAYLSILNSPDEWFNSIFKSMLLPRLVSHGIIRGWEHRGNRVSHLHLKHPFPRKEGGNFMDKCWSTRVLLLCTLKEKHNSNLKQYLNVTNPGRMSFVRHHGFERHE